MAQETNRVAKQQYRRRLRDNGRREVLMDLPTDLLDAIDRLPRRERRALVVEDLLRFALKTSHA